MLRNVNMTSDRLKGFPTARKAVNFMEQTYLSSYIPDLAGRIFSRIGT